MNKVNIKINGENYKVDETSTILEVCRENNIDIPTLCYLKDINEIGACRMCLVEIKGARSLQASCVYPVSEGLEISTNTKRVRSARKTNLELLLSNHDRSCLTCERNKKCELQTLSEELGVTDIEFEGETIKHEIDDKSNFIIRDNNKCILCKRCVNVCKNIQTTNVISTNERGFKSKIGSPFDMSLSETPCINCGQCINVCPTGALREKSSIDRVWEHLNDDDKHVIIQTAPSVRTALGEEFGMEMGTRVTGKMVNALKKMGFDKVFDTNTGADITIMEEGHELLDRIENGGKLPMITSCSPGWVNFCESFYPEFIENLSSCKSPMTMLGAVLKSYYAEKEELDKEKIINIAVMPCTAKKEEITRKEMEVNDLRDIDEVITTRELAKMIKISRIDFKNLENEKFDNPLGEASGAGAIFGTTGGVMEAALRTIYELKTGDRLGDYVKTRGKDGIKEFSLNLPNKILKGVVVSGTGNARKVLNMVKNNEAEYDFIEVMGCPGGCIMGGGQPIVDSKTRGKKDVFKLRASAIYDEDQKATVRRSHENEFIKKLYDEFLGEPLSHKSHEYLHTSYNKKQKY